MSTNFPTSLDTFTIPSGSSTLGGSTPTHTAAHTNAADAIAALEAKVGVNSSAVTTSLDYKVTNRVQVAGDIGGTAASPQVTATHLASPLPIAQGGTASTIGLVDGFFQLATNPTFTNAAQTATTVTVAVASNATYLVDCAVIFSNTTGNTSISWTGPASATMQWNDTGASLDYAATIGATNTYAANAGTRMAFFKGALFVSATSGSLTLTLGVSAGTTTLNSGSWLRLQRVA